MCKCDNKYAKLKCNHLRYLVWRLLEGSMVEEK